MLEILIDVLGRCARIIGARFEVSKVEGVSSNGSLVREENRIAVVERKFCLIRTELSKDH